MAAAASSTLFYQTARRNLPPRTRSAASCNSENAFTMRDAGKKYFQNLSFVIFPGKIHVVTVVTDSVWGVTDEVPEVVFDCF